MRIIGIDLATTAQHRAIVVDGRSSSSVYIWCRMEDLSAELGLERGQARR
jgi:hypothetical protein